MNQAQKNKQNLTSFIDEEKGSGRLKSLNTHFQHLIVGFGFFHVFVVAVGSGCFHFWTVAVLWFNTCLNIFISTLNI